MKGKERNGKLHTVGREPRAGPKCLLRPQLLSERQGVDGSSRCALARREGPHSSAPTACIF